jgi:hypothetical protein
MTLFFIRDLFNSFKEISVYILAESYEKWLTTEIEV